MVVTITELKTRESRLRARREYMKSALARFAAADDFSALANWSPLASRVVSRHESALADLVAAIEIARNVSLPPVSESRE